MISAPQLSFPLEVEEFLNERTMDTSGHGDLSSRHLDAKMCHGQMYDEQPEKKYSDLLHDINSDYDLALSPQSHHQYSPVSTDGNHFQILQPIAYDVNANMQETAKWYTTTSYQPYMPHEYQSSGEYSVADESRRDCSLSPPGNRDSQMYYHDNSGYESDTSVELIMSNQTMSSSVDSGYYAMDSKYYNPSKLENEKSGCKLPNFQDMFNSLRQPKGPRRGRPVTYMKPGHYYSDSDNMGSDEDERVTSTSPPRCRRGAKNILLWKFLLKELRNPEVTHVKWENEHEGTFKFVDTTECSRLWGEMKKKSDMNFEKLSRGIRHYYRDGLMSRKDGIRLVYKFNWERVPRQFRPCGRC